ncbi:HK97 family phage prohead protease [Prescottella equi]
MDHDEPEIRSAADTDEIEIRSVPIGKVDKDTRTVRGIAVPYGQVTSKVIGYREEFRKGSIADGTKVNIHVNHRTYDQLPIGKILEGRNTDSGYEIEFRIANTPRGDEVLELIREGVLGHLSVGFRPVSHEMRDEVVVRTKVDLREVSIVEHPAYKGATIAKIRSAATSSESEDRMDPEELARLIAEDANVAQLRSDNEEMTRRIAVLEAGDSRHAPEVRCHSGGEFLQALARGDKEIIDEYRGVAKDLEERAFTGQTTDDTVMRPAWIDKMLRLVDRKRPMTNLFSKEPMPATGNTVEYPYVKTETGTVAVQANEGDDLAYMEIALGFDSAKIRTVGGYTSLSRQVIERSTLAHLDTVLRYMGIQYAVNFEAFVRAYYNALPTADADARKNANLLDVGAKPVTARDWISVTFDACALIEDNAKGLEGEFIVASRDVAKEIVLIEDSQGRPVFAFNGDGANTWGDLSLNKNRIVGKINHLPVVEVPDLSAGTFGVASSDAITTQESAGAPVRLQDENIINLTKDFSLYGYQAIYSEQPQGITKVTWTP